MHGGVNAPSICAAEASWRHRGERRLEVGGWSDAGASWPRLPGPAGRLPLLSRQIQPWKLRGANHNGNLGTEADLVTQTQAAMEEITVANVRTALTTGSLRDTVPEQAGL